jgi:hypothetical protein
MAQAASYPAFRIKIYAFQPVSRHRPFVRPIRTIQREVFPMRNLILSALMVLAIAATVTILTVPVYACNFPRPDSCGW